ncbi:MAG: hypothetical protein IPH41_11010 [Sulfuritalea sp.]|nr:hypothetical protein [Sulfuritalea sp.]
MAERIIPEEAQRTAGALECLAQIRVIEHTAENLRRKKQTPGLSGLACKSRREWTSPPHSAR